jgi:predicted dinucleotide-binding enzyme
MKIGVLGSGNMGRSLGLLFAEQGHEVLFGARDVAKARAAAELSSRPSRSGSILDAAEFGEVLIYGVRAVWPAELLGSNAGVLAGKILIDMNNDETRTDGGIGPVGDSLAEKLQSAAPAAFVVKAFNTMAQEVFEVPTSELLKANVNVYLASDHAPAKTRVAELARSIGFEPVDMGGLKYARMLEGLADVTRHLLMDLGHPLPTAILVRNLPIPTAPRLGGRQPSKLK